MQGMAGQSEGCLGQAEVWVTRDTASDTVHARGRVSITRGSTACVQVKILNKAR